MEAIYTTCSIYTITNTVANINWGPEQEKAIQKVQAAMQTLLSLGPNSSAVSIVVKVLWQLGCLMELLINSNRRIIGKPTEFGVMTCLLMSIIF